MSKPSMKLLSLALLSALAFAAPAFAGPNAKLPAELPPYGQDKPIPVPQIEKKTLANGMEIWVVPRSGLPRVDFVLAVRGAGLAADDASHPGFAGLLASLLSEGTDKRDSRAIAETAQGLGGGVGAGAGNDGITVAANALASNAGPMLELLAEVARQPSFPDKEVVLAKANALQALKVSEAQPGFRAERALSQAIYGEHPYGRTQPTAAAIEGATREYLQAEHARRFRPERSLLVIAGRIDAKQAIKLAEAAFADWQRARQRAAPNSRRHRRRRPRAACCWSVRAACSPPCAWAARASPRARPTTCRCAWRAPSSAAASAAASTRTCARTRATPTVLPRVRAPFRNGGAIVGGADVRNEVTGAALKEFFSEYKRFGTEPGQR